MTALGKTAMVLSVFWPSFTLSDSQNIFILVDSCLYSHNKLRDLHPGTPHMTWDNQLENDARKWANHIANEGISHQNGIDEGENIFYKWFTGSKDVTCAEATLAW